MKAVFLPLLFAFICLLTNETADAQLLKKIKDKVANKTEEKAESKTPEKTEEPEKKEETEKTEPAEQTENKETTKASTPSFKSYANYDFVPGDKVLFEDNFNDEQDGEFPSHWELKAGQAVMNKVDNVPALFLTEGNYVRVDPRMKVESYLTDPFTIEYDTYFTEGSYGLIAMLQFNDKKEGYQKEAAVSVNSSEASFNGETSFSKALPEQISGDNYVNHWHHIAIAYKNKQLKVYADQYRVLVVPDTKQEYEKVEFAGIGDEKSPMVLKNVRIASGGSMNMIGKKFTDAKIVTHGINFDYNKSVIRPESMGTLNMIVQVMKDNPDIKFEIGGYTDSDGDDKYNQKLSDERAAAVRQQLISMGIDGSRLTSKGYGETKPISDNTSPEGKANNRRVEFVKK